MWHGRLVDVDIFGAFSRLGTVLHLLEPLYLTLLQHWNLTHHNLS